MSDPQKTTRKPARRLSRACKMRHVPRYVVVKRGNLYWQPSRALAAQGWKPMRLPDDRVAAYRQADECNARLDAWRATGDLAKDSTKIREGSVAWLIRAYKASKDWESLRPRTQKDYRAHLAAIEDAAGPMAAAAIDRSFAYEFQQVAAATLGARQYAYRMQVLRLLLSWGERTGKVPTNAATKMRISMPKSRDAIWSPDQFAAFSSAADDRMALAMMLALWSGQRQGDVLAMKWSDIDAGRIVIRQSKTGATVHIPISKPLAAFLDRATRTEAPTILTNPAGESWGEHQFRAAWVRTQKRAKVAGVTFLDLRRTAVCALAEAGCTTPEIAAITGHSQATISRIMEVYLKSTRKLADAAMRKLEG